MSILIKKEIGPSAPVVSSEVNQGFSPVTLRDFSDVLNYPPFTTNSHRKLVVVCDFDGVLSQAGKQGSGFKRMRALQQLAQQTNTFIFSSSRMPIPEGVGNLPFPVTRKRFSSFPFMTSSSQQRLERFIKHANSNCEVKFSLGLGKVFGDQQEFAESHIGALEDENDLVIIGSNKLDKRQVNQLRLLAERKEVSTKNLYYPDTGHVFL